MTVGLVPVFAFSAFHGRALALAVVGVPEEVVRAVLGAAHALAQTLVPDLVGVLACLRSALAGAIVHVQVLALCASMVSRAVALAPAGVGVPVLARGASVKASWLNADAGTGFGVEVV